MRSVLFAVRNGLAVLGVIVLVGLLATVSLAQFGDGGNARRNVWIPSVFSLTFGDLVSTDVALQKNGSNVLGISGNLGGGGSTANTTASPIGPFAWGTAVSAASTVTVTFARAFTNPPVCYAADQTAKNAVQVTSNATTVTIANAGTTDTDTVAWFCLGNPN